jgi:hypothetical protein
MIGVAFSAEALTRSPTYAGLLGHARSSITSRYIHPDKALLAAADLVAGETMRLMRAAS